MTITTAAVMRQEKTKVATIKYVVYYTIIGGTKINRDYPDMDSSLDSRQVRGAWLGIQANNGNHQRVYADHEPHNDYTTAYAAAGMVGADPDIVRIWLRDRVNWLRSERAKALQAKAATLLPAADTTTHAGKKPGDIVRDQNGRSGRVPQVPLEVFRPDPIDPERAWKAVRDSCKGGG